MLRLHQLRTNRQKNDLDGLDRYNVDRGMYGMEVEVDHKSYGMKQQGKTWYLNVAQHLLDSMV